MGRWIAVFGLLATVFFASGCSIKYKAVGVFDDTGEVFVGDLDHNLWSGRAQILAKSLSSDTVCRGYSYVTYAPISFGCSGQQGKAPLLCSDGRQVVVDWTAESCSSGTGYGTDQYGNTFSLAFGFDEAETRTTLATLTGKPINDANAGNAANDSAGDAAPQNKQSGVATGTGFFITKTGVLVTNHHVVEGAGKISVIREGQRYAASVMQVDANNDLALLQVEGLRPQPLALGSASKLKRGDEILVLGYPLPDMQGDEQKATMGRVNALSGAQDDIRFIQMDAPVQPGNSGGPLLNAKGEVVGIVSAGLGVKALMLSGAIPQNVGYAVKIDYLRPLLQAAAIDSGLPQSKNGPADMPEVIARCEDAVIQIETVR